MQKPACLPQCSSISRLSLHANGDEIKVNLQLHSLADTAWLLPVPLHLLKKITLDQMPAPLFSEENEHWLFLPKGQHQLELQLDLFQGMQYSIVAFVSPSTNRIPPDPLLE